MQPLVWVRPNLVQKRGSMKTGVWMSGSSAQPRGRTPCTRDLLRYNRTEVWQSVISGSACP